MELRKVTTKQDIEIIKSFFYEIFPEESDYNLIHFKWSVTGQHNFKRLEYYFVCENGAIVGVSGIYAVKEDECWLGWFGVRPKYRQKGYASAMLDLQLRLMQGNGYKVCRLYTDTVINKNAVGLYLKKGFQKDSAYKGNIITMAKSLDNLTVPQKWTGIPLCFGEG